MRFLTIVLLLAVLLTGYVCYQVYLPYGVQTETFVEIPPGTHTPEMAKDLQDPGVIRSPWGFEVLRLIKGGKLKAGEYRFDHPLNLMEVYARLAKGDVFTIALSVPPGYNSVEGFLFPDTYHFSRHATAEQMIAAMVRRFRQEAATLGLSTQVRETVTMASLVEKETAVPEERPLVAGVFFNRLAKGMPLQTDPSVIYAAVREGGYRGTIYASDLKNESAYNTYQHAGLPPGPICNPGMDALQAAMHPAQTNYLYFVSDAAGHSKFSEDMTTQTQNVEAYRRALASQK